MPLNKLAQSLRAKQKADKLSITAMANAIGANAQSVTGALKGKTVPNKTTAPKFAKFLGLSIEEFTTLTKGEAKPTAPVKAAKKSTKGKKVKKIKAVAKTTVKPVKVREVTLAEAAELASDALAVATHRATAAQRKIIEAVLGL